MFELETPTFASKQEHYEHLVQQARGLLQGEPDLIANAANFSALVYHGLPQLNWAGFYLFDGPELVVGPFQGKPACIRIALGRGVCGTAASERQTQVVRDVSTHPNHIYCDAASQSEIVVPLVSRRPLLGVWDVDSPVTDRFDEDDRAGMEALCAVFMALRRGRPRRHGSAVRGVHGTRRRMSQASPA